jgi:hypothetical protein
LSSPPPFKFLLVVALTFPISGDASGIKNLATRQVKATPGYPKIMTTLIQMMQIGKANHKLQAVRPIQIMLM